MFPTILETIYPSCDNGHWNSAVPTANLFLNGNSKLAQKAIRLFSVISNFVKFIFFNCKLLVACIVDQFCAYNGNRSAIISSMVL